MTNPFNVKKPLKTTSMQIKLTEKEKAILQLLVKRSDQKNTSKFVMNLISDEFLRMAEIDDEIEEFLFENYISDEEE